MNILFAYPNQILIELLFNEEKYIFLDEKGIWIYNKETLKRDFIDLINVDIDFALFNINTRDQINSWSPIWTRWLSGSFNYEHLRSNALNIDLKLKTCLNNYKINLVIFFTGIPHHIDTSLLSIACSSLNIPKLFLYSNVIDGRLIPLIEIKTIYDRKPIDTEFSSINYDRLLENFLSNRLAGNAPIVNTKLNYLKTNYYFSTFKTIFFLFKSKLIKKLRNNSILWSDFKANISFLDVINLNNKQKSFLSNYNKLKLNIDESTKFINKKNNKIIIAAHFQPEATTFPEGGNYSNHLEIIYKLKNLGYIGDIGYKEHPATKIYHDDFVGITRVGIYRSLEYLEHLKNLNCVFLSENSKLDICINKIYNYIPLTITGTIAIERSLCGLHTIVAGQPWFIRMPGVIHIEDLKNLTKVEDSWVTPNVNVANSAKLFLTKMLNNKTIENVPGIGTGKPIHNDINIQKFRNGILVLINSISTIKN
jgi:hypothetical protein